MKGVRVRSLITGDVGTITAVGGRYGDIKAILWDDGVKSSEGAHDIGITWDYEED